MSEHVMGLTPPEQPKFERITIVDKAEIERLQKELKNRKVRGEVQILPDRMEITALNGTLPNGHATYESFWNDALNSFGIPPETKLLCELHVTDQEAAKVRAGEQTLHGTVSRNADGHVVFTPDRDVVTVSNGYPLVDIEGNVVGYSGGQPVIEAEPVQQFGPSTFSVINKNDWNDGPVLPADPPSGKTVMHPAAMKALHNLLRVDFAGSEGADEPIIVKPKEE